MYPELSKYKDINNINELEFVNFGTGFGFYDFVYDGLDVKAFNFSLTQQTLEFDYKLMKYYSSKFAERCKICLILPYTILCAHNVREIMDINERYYSILPKEDVEGSCNTSYEVYAKKKVALEHVENTLYIKTALSEEDMMLQSIDAIDNWKRELGILSFDTGEMTIKIENAIKHEVIWLNKIIEFCNKSNWELFILIPPMSRIILNMISLEFRETHFYKPMYEIIADKIQVLDYVKANKYCNPDMYGWPGFLIQDVAKEFTKDVLKQVGVIK